jgi:hypothetical protein
VTTSDGAEDYKLLGISRDEFLTLAPPIADQYASAGGLARFNAVPAATPKPPAPAPGKASPPPPKPPAPTPPSPADLSWLTEAGSDAAVDREISTRLGQKRDQVLAVKMKDLYKHVCMACGETLVIGLDPERRYAEAAHIKPLGKPHNGPDKAGNLIVLCPGHHIQLDRGIISLESAPGGGVRFVSRIPKDPVHKKAVTLTSGHTLDAACVSWHTATFFNIGKCDSGAK